MSQTHLKVSPAIKIFTCLLTAITLTFILSACQTNNGAHQWNYNWKYQPEQSADAQQPPHTLAQADAVAAILERQAQNGTKMASATYPGSNTMQSGIDPEMASAAIPELPPVHVAILVPLSGQHKQLGQAMLNAAQLALFDTGHNNFQLIPEDTQGTPQGAKQAASSALNKGADIVLGPVFANSVRAAKPITSSRGINMIAFSTDWTLADRYTYVMGFLPFDQVERVTSYAAAHDLKNIGFIAPHNSYGNIVANTFQTLAPRYGIEIAEQQIFNPMSRNLTPDVRKFSYYDERQTQLDLLKTKSNANANDNDDELTLDQIPLPYDAILMPVGGQQAITISSLMAKYGLTPDKVKRLGTGLLDDNGLTNEPGLNGTWIAAPSPKLRRDFEQKYKATYGTSAPRLATLAYDTTALTAVLARTGIEETGRPSFDRASLTNPNGFFGIDGIFRFRPDGTAERGLAILEFRNGSLVVIDEAPTTFEQSDQQNNNGRSF